ncbi:holo-ACP synthase [Solicola sp. PLA-1-18]|uniref:holo-ACP synthase n=1 Tax=Solicola sp. PLA-1-18 TaxID=3380532 RepID=UPI003B7E9E0C
MIVGVGIDVVDIARFAESLERTPALSERLFTDAEKHLPVGSLAGRFAVKEALAKALGAPAGLAWLDAEVVNDPDGRPLLTIAGTIAERAAQLGVTSHHLSISHDGGIASAFVVLES